MKTKIDPQIIAKLRELLEQATPRPWAWQPTGEKDASWSIGLTEPPFAGGLAYGDHYYEPIEHVAWGEGSFADPALIAAAVNALSGLLDDAEENARLRAEVEQYKAANSVLGGEWCKEIRAAGRNPCGACAICCGEARAEVERLQSELDEMRNGRDAAMSAAEALRTHLDALRKENG